MNDIKLGRKPEYKEKKQLELKIFDAYLRELQDLARDLGEFGKRVTCKCKI